MANETYPTHPFPVYSPISGFSVGETVYLINAFKLEIYPFTLLSTPDLDGECRASSTRFPTQTLRPGSFGRLAEAKAIIQKLISSRSKTLQDKILDLGRL